MSFSCPDPDFVIRCLPEDVIFNVKKARLVKGSKVFYDMFSCCEQEGTSMDIYDSADMFSLLLCLLHNHPLAYSTTKDKKSSKYEFIIPHSAIIPLPVLPRLFDLADKYALNESIIHALRTHLVAHASTAPLLVYGLASQFSLPDIADEASAFLVAPPLHTYTSEVIRVIPTAEAYHRLLLLQHHRETRIKELLMTEELFPHGYGTCPAHADSTKMLWEKKRGILLLRVDGGTDVAAEMATVLQSLESGCPTCHKAWLAATDMLAYKCQKIVRRISKLPKGNP